MKIYPNPAGQQITIEVHEELIGERFKIIDNRGVEVYTGCIQEEKNIIDIDVLPAAQYHIEILGETIPFVKRN